MLNLNYKKYGERGRNVVILHGLLGTFDNWQSIANHLSSFCKVYSLDQRNHGRSPHTDEMNYELLAYDVINFLEFHQLKDVVLIGHSMGGKVAMLVALERPDLISTLVVVDIAPKNYKGGHEVILEAMNNVPLHQTQSRKAIEDFVCQTIKSKAVVQFILKNLSRNTDNTFHWKCNLDSITKNYHLLMAFPEINTKFHKSTYFIKGELSDYISENDVELCKQIFSLAKFITIKNATHWVHADNPKDFLNTVEHIINTDE